MKRVLVLCMLIVVAFSGIVHAEIIKGTDSFSGEAYISSWQYPKPLLDTLNFHKDIKTDGEVSYTLSISQITSKDFVLEDFPIEVKIGNHAVQKLTDYRYKMTGPDSYGIKYNSMIDARFPAELAEMIKNAEKVAIRFEHAEGTRVPYVLPNNILSEWKEVIATEK